MAPTLVHASGRQVTIPDGLEAVYLENGWSVPGAPAAAPAVREGDPSEEWKVKELEAYAESRSIDLGKAKKKDEILAVFAAAATPPAGADGAAESETGGESSEGDDGGSDAGEGESVSSDADGSADDES